MGTLKIIAITAMVIVMIITGLLIGCTIAAINTCKKSYKCKHCRRFNPVLTGECQFCKSDAIYKKVTYRSFILGKVNSLDKNGNCSWKKTKNWMIVEGIIWVIIAGAEIAGLIAIIILM